RAQSRFWPRRAKTDRPYLDEDANAGRARCPNASRRTTNAQLIRPSKPSNMRIAPFLEDFAVRRQGVPVRSAQFVRVPVYIRGALRTTRPTSFGSGYADPGTDAPY